MIGTGRKDARLTGYMAEHYVMYQLAKRGIRASLIDSFVGNYDIITQHDIRIEVKSARERMCWNGKKTAQTLMWHFNNGKKVLHFDKGLITATHHKRDKQCDFFIFIGFDGGDEIKKVFIVPKEIIGDRKTITVPVDRKRTTMFTKINFDDYIDRWDLLEPSALDTNTKCKEDKNDN